MAKTKQKPAWTPETAASAADVMPAPKLATAVTAGPVALQHYSDALPCDASLRRSAAKLLRAGVPLDWVTAQAVAETLPEASVREIIRHELDRDLSQLYERLIGKN